MKIRLLASSDVHATIMPYRYSDLKPCDHGFLKLMAKMEELSDDYTLRIDNGDMLEGSPFLSYYYKYGDGKNPMINLMNEAKYDYINIGNHDLNYGQKNLFDYINNITAKCLTGNIKYKGKTIGQDYVVHKFDEGHQIAIIGVVTQYLINWEKPNNLKDIEVLDAYEYVKNTIETIKRKENVKGIVVVYHGGFEKDLESGVPTESLTGENEAYQMCQDLDIDVLISGHQHRSFATIVNKTHTTQTAYNGSELALIEWDLDSQIISQEIVKVNTNNYHINDEVKSLNDKVEKWLDEKVGEVMDVDLKVEDEFLARLHKHPVISFINNVQKDASGAMLSGNALFNGAVGFDKIITMRDIVSTYVYPNTVVSYEINGKILKEYLEKCAEYFDVEDDQIVVSKDYIYPKPQHYNYDMVDGVEYTIKVSNDIGNRIVDLKYQGRDVKEDDIFTLALSNYRAAGGGNYFMFDGCKVVRDIQVDMVTLIAEYLYKNPNLYVNHKNNINVII